MNVQPKQIKLSNSLNSSISLVHWEQEDPVGLVVFTHGLAGYAMRYRELASVLHKYGLAVVGVDLTGHGLSEGIRGYVDDFEEYIDDYGKAVQFSLEKYGTELPLFSFGHSMGATVTAHYVLRNQDRFTGSIFMGIAMYVTDSIPEFLIAASKLVSQLWPSLPAAKLDASLTSSLPEKVREYKNDPLIYSGRVRARTGYSFMMNAEALKNQVQKLFLPLLILHGEKDGLCNPEGSRHLYEQSGSTDKLINIYPELFHEILNEKQGPEIVLEIKNWILTRIEKIPK